MGTAGGAPCTAEMELSPRNTPVCISAAPRKGHPTPAPPPHRPPAELAQEGADKSTRDAKRHGTRGTGEQSGGRRRPLRSSTLWWFIQQIPPLSPPSLWSQGQDRLSVNSHGFISPSRIIRSSRCPSNLFYNYRIH